MLADLAVFSDAGWLILLAPYGVLLVAWLRARVLFGKSGLEPEVGSRRVGRAAGSDDGLCNGDEANGGYQCRDTLQLAGSCAKPECPAAGESADGGGRAPHPVVGDAGRDEMATVDRFDATLETASDLNVFSSRSPTASQFPSPSEPSRARRAGGVAAINDVGDLEREVAAADLATVVAEIEGALAVEDQAALGVLYLRHGVLLKRAGDMVVAGDIIRKSVGIAMQRADARLHALGRLELGDIAAQRGDLTTACEHWQLAKQMFLDVRQQRDGDVADRRMVDHGCPSEWVLTEF